MALAVAVEVLEQLDARQVAAALDDAREPRIADRDAVLDAALAAEGEAQLAAGHAHVPAPQRGESEGFVLARVLVVADADQGPVEQPHHRGEDLAAAQPAGTQVALDALAQRGQRLAELQHAAELGAVARFPVRRVVAILLAPPRVARSGLDVAFRVGADPYLRPGRRDRQAVEPLPDARIGNAGAAGLEIHPARADASARDAASAVADVVQPRARRRAAVLRQSALMPALRINLVHFSMSRATRASASPPEMRIGSAPRFSSIAAVSGMAAARSKSARRRASTGSGVPARTK